MSDITFQIAEREGARLVLGLGGVSGGGKTFTALQIAYGLANYNAKKIAFICTENRRGRLYSDAIKDANGVVQQFFIHDLIPPFSPQRYNDVIEAAARQGFEVLVIDSVSHEWEGQGGCEEIATQGDPKIPRWNKAKAEHKRFMNAMLQSPMHVIACMRARPKVKMVKRNGNTEFEDLGVLPIQEKNFTFELTASMMMWDGGQSREVIKCPSDIADIFGKPGAELHTGFLGADHGFRLRQWIDGGKTVDQEAQAARDRLSLEAEKGMEALQAAWKALPVAMRKRIDAKGCPDDLKSAAQAFDRQRADQKPGGAELDELNREIAGQQD